MNPIADAAFIASSVAVLSAAGIGALVGFFNEQSKSDEKEAETERLKHADYTHDEKHAQWQEWREWQKVVARKKVVRDEREASEGELKQREFVRGLNKYAPVAKQRDSVHLSVSETGNFRDSEEALDSYFNVDEVNEEPAVTAD